MRTNYRIHYRGPGGPVIALKAQELPTWTFMIGARWLQVTDNERGALVIHEDALIDVVNKRGNVVKITDHN